MRTSTGAGFWARNKPSYWDAKKKTKDYQFHLDIFKSFWTIRDWIFPDHLDPDSSQDCPPPIHIVPTVLPTVPCTPMCSSHLVFWAIRVLHSWISNQNPSLFVMIHFSFLSTGVALHTSLCRHSNLLALPQAHHLTLLSRVLKGSPQVQIKGRFSLLLPRGA